MMTLHLTCIAPLRVPSPGDSKPDAAYEVARSNGTFIRNEISSARIEGVFGPTARLLGILALAFRLAHQAAGEGATRHRSITSPHR